MSSSITRRVNLIVFITLCSVKILQCSLLEDVISRNMEFKCGMDICTVGVHFCSLDDDACVQCNEDVCNEPDSPSMCNLYCDGQ